MFGVMEVCLVYECVCVCVGWLFGATCLYSARVNYIRCCVLCTMYMFVINGK